MYHAVPDNGAVILTVAVVVAVVLLKLAVPMAPPETLGYPKAFSAELYAELPLNPVSITVVLS